MTGRRRAGAALLALLALHSTGCLTAYVADAASGVKNGLAVRAVATIDAAYVETETEPEPGLVLCGAIAAEPRTFLQSSDLGDPTSFVAFVPAARLGDGGRVLSYAEFHPRYKAPCACLERLPGARAVAVGSGGGEPVVELVNPGGYLHPDVRLEQQELRVAATQGLVASAAEHPLGPRGAGNPAYWVLAPPTLAIDVASFVVLIPAVIAVEFVWVGYVLAAGMPEPDPNDPALDPCTQMEWLNERLARD